MSNSWENIEPTTPGRKAGDLNKNTKIVFDVLAKNVKGTGAKKMTGTTFEAVGLPDGTVIRAAKKWAAKNGMKVTAAEHGVKLTVKK